MYVPLQELYDIHDGLVAEHKMTPFYRLIKRWALAQRAYTINVLIKLAEKRVMAAQERHYCGPACKAEEN